MRTARALAFTVTLATSIALAACGPAADPTATTAPQPTATKVVAATATTGAPIATSAAATATRPAATATVAEVKNRPVPVVAAPVNPLAKKGGIYREGLSNDFPFDYSVWSGSLGANMAQGGVTADTLLQRNEFVPDKGDQILSNVAYDWWVDGPGTTWTFKLRDNVKFSDGVKFTCADAKFSLDAIRLGRDAKGSELSASPRGKWFARVKDTKCADDYTLNITTEGQLPSLPASLSIGSITMNGRHVFEGNLKLMTTQSGPGIGAWVQYAVVAPEFIKYKRNADYWDQPFPYMDEYWWVGLGSSTASTAAFRVGRLEGGPAPSKDVRAQMIAEGRAIQPSKGASDSMTFYQANWTKSPWNDKRFSLALRCAVDSRKAIETAQNGEGFEGPVFPLSTVPGGSPWSISEADWKAVHPCHGPSGDPANMEKRRQIAKDLLKEMGFTAENPAKPTGYTTKDDQTFVSVINDLALVGIQVQYITVTTQQRYDIQVNALKDILQQGAVDSRRDPDHWLYGRFYSTSDRNYGKYVNAELDALIDQQSKTLDATKRNQLLNQIEKLILRDNAQIIIYHTQSTKVFASWVKDYYYGQPDNRQNTSYRLTRAWIDQETFKKFGAQ